MIKPQFGEVWDFSEGLSRVNVGGTKDEGYYIVNYNTGKYGYINKEGNFVIKPSNNMSQRIEIFNPYKTIKKIFYAPANM